MQNHADSSSPASPPAPAVHSGLALDRRAVLRGAGISLALPWLSAMAPASARRLAPAPKRFAALFCPNGMLPAAWRPAGTGRGFAFSPTLEPLRPHRERIAILGNLRNFESRRGEGHYVKTTAWLSGAPVKRTGGRDLAVGTSIDQHLSARLGGSTPLESLVLGIEPVRNRVDMGYSTVYGANVSWRTATVPAAREISPRRALERLARWSEPAAQPRTRLLDLVHREGKALRSRLGASDRHKIDEYLHSVGALEDRIAAMEARELDMAAANFDPDSAAQAKSYADRVDLMLDLVAEAFRTDSTRFATFMFGNAVSSQNFSFLDGVEGGHHPLSHHENKPEKLEQYARINRWHVEQFARLLSRLEAIDERDGTALDSSAILFGSGLADGNRHDPKDLPIVLAGGLFHGGVHLRQGSLTPLCNVYTSIQGAMGAGPLPFGDANGPLDGLLPRT
ncbi:MAG: DUF1552 domain-containing protein [Planctomycetota bacterium]